MKRSNLSLLGILSVLMTLLNGCSALNPSTFSNTTTVSEPLTTFTSTSQTETDSQITTEYHELLIWLNPGIDTVEINSTFVDSGAQASINNRFVSTEVSHSTLDMTKVGSYHISYRAEAEGQIREVVRVVTVVDETPPIASLNAGVDTIIEGSAWIDAGISVSDNSFGDVIVTKEGQVSCGVQGEYWIKYMATDASGNITEIVRYINVLKPSQ